MSCGSRMPRGEQIAKPAERGTRLAGPFFSASHGLEQLALDTQAVARINSLLGVRHASSQPPCLRSSGGPGRVAVSAAARQTATADTANSRSYDDMAGLPYSPSAREDILMS